MAKPDAAGDADRPRMPEADRDAWAELAVAAGRESLIAQRSELDNMRTRAVSFAALTVTAIAFLVGTGLNSDVPRNGWFYLFAGIGSVAFVMLAWFLVRMIAPRVEFDFILNPKDLMNWVDGDARAPTKAWALRGLATHEIPAMLEKNAESLKTIRRLYKRVLVLGVATTAFWIIVVWIFT